MNVKLLSHVNLLERNMYLIMSRTPKTQYPLLFEYYSAVYMTHKYLMPFNVWQDIPSHKKRNSCFPVHDMGVDLSNGDLTHIVQSKYYAKHNTITYGRLATFLATPVLTGKKNIKMTLIRTSHSYLDDFLMRIVKRGDITDVTLSNDAFLEDIDAIQKRYTNAKGF